MTSLACLLVLEILVITARHRVVSPDVGIQPSHPDLSYFEHRGFQSSFDNCVSPFPVRSLLVCVRFYVNSPHPTTCISVNFLPDGNDVNSVSTSGACQACLAVSSYTLVPNAFPSQKSYTPINNTGFPTSDQPFVYLDPNLYEGQALTFQVHYDTQLVKIMLLTEARWSNTQQQNGDCNLGLTANHVRNVVVMDNFRSGSRYWQHHRAYHQASDYFTPGLTSEMIITVLDTAYYFYVDGKSMGSYPRPSHLPLDKITHLRLSANIKRVTWTGNRKLNYL